MGAQRNHLDCKVGLYGVPYDGTTSFRPGTRFGPSAIREVSNGLETYCPKLNLDLEEMKFVDLGSLIIPFGAPEPIIEKVKVATKKLISLGLKPLMLGGEHSITSGAITALTQIHTDLILVQLDAHADLRDTWLGTRHSHACSMRRCLDVLPSKQLFQVGIRSGTYQEFQEIRTRNTLIELAPNQPAILLDEALKPYLGRPLYITLDLDWFDPSVMPGTGTPEPGGYYWHDFESIIEILKKHHLIGADIVELAPQIDPSGASSLLAAKATRSLIMILNESQRPK